MTRLAAASALLALSFFAAFSIAAEPGESYVPGRPVDASFDEVAKPFLTNHCADCHGDADSAPEGGLSLTELGPVNEVNAAIWKAIWAQVALKEMPPPETSELGVVERLRFTDWVVGELTDAMRDKGGFQDHRDPDKGNFVDHDLLFGKLPPGVRLVPTSSPARLWRLTPEEHITRLNDLINTEPSHDPEKPGLRAHGDAVPTNHGGELKLYFGVDRILQWQGGTVAYATAVKSVPAALSSPRDHGLKNYPDLTTVNSAEATQILGMAGDILRYMAVGPLSIAEPYQITDDPKLIADKMKGDLRGLPTSIVYSTKTVRPLTPVIDLFEAEEIADESLRSTADYLFEALTFRPPTDEESDAYLAIVRDSVERLGREDGAVLGLSALFLDRDALFRPELVDYGEPDEYGRVMLQGWELGLAVNHALRYVRPDESLRTAVLESRMRTRDDVRREVERLLADETVRKPRILQFFRDYFDYDRGGYVCKDTRALAQAGVIDRGDAHYRAMFDAAASSDRLIERVLDDDRDVLKRLLTTDEVVATSADSLYFGRLRTDEERKVAEKEAKRVAAAAEKRLAAEIETAEREVAELESKLHTAADAKGVERSLVQKKNERDRLKNEAARNPGRRGFDAAVAEADLSGPTLYARVGRRSFGAGSLKPERTLAVAPEGERLGILTHPSWLVSHSDAMDNHAIRRGRWVRERLLGGGIPDVPITVDAMLPDEPQNTLRERMRVTREDYCWTCHEKMDPLGLPFEMYNHAGLYRTTELGKPVDASGEIVDSGSSDLDGEVSDALEMIRKIAESERAEQVFVRHAFRFWMGRNDTLHDAPVLQAAHRAYRESGGSMRALLVSLLTSDAFLYRTRDETPQAASP